jgi:hypothetical protein
MQGAEILIDKPCRYAESRGAHLEKSKKRFEQREVDQIKNKAV